MGEFPFRLAVFACLLALLAIPVTAADCDQNGVEDADDIAAGAADCNLNGFPDSCETATENGFAVPPESFEPVDFLELICTEVDFERVSIPSMRGQVTRAGKYIVPARADASLLPTVFQNVDRFALHQDFLREVFPERFANLTLEEYISLVEIRSSRDYYVGVISRLESEEGIRYGFNVIVDESRASELLTQEEVGFVYDSLKPLFTLEPLGYSPETIRARDAAAAFPNPSFPMFLDRGPQVEYEPYTNAVGYGRVRLLDREAFDMANETGQISFQSIFVLDFSPRDIEGVLGGIITAEPQGELSHLSIRTARRGTPNAFVLNAFEVLGDFEDKLVRLEVTSTEATMTEATLKEAEAFWATNRPTLAKLPDLDTEFSELADFDQINALEAAGEAIVPRFGGKASNLARLRKLFQGDFEEYQERGFAIPVHYYVEFTRANKMPSFFDDERDVTYEEYINELIASEEFQSDSTVRFAALDDLRDHMRDEGVVSPDLVARVITRIGEVFGTPETRRVRFRSSSNVEDSVEFNGAGLYNSTSGCPADDNDGDDLAPSHCDPTRDEERTVARAIKRVWRSLWNFRAYEERAFYAIPHDITAMGVLVNRTFIDEAANGVAFTGNTNNSSDRRYVITVQPGEESVVSPEPGILAEKDLLTIENAEVTNILRVTPSTLLEDGELVLSDDQLRELGRVMAHMDDNFPIETGDFPRNQVLLDLEFKFMPDGELAVKQVRPFLLAEPPTDVPQTPTFELQVPEGLEICGAFGVAGGDRNIESEYELKSILRLHGGSIELPTLDEVFEAELFEEVRFGPAQDIATAQAPGQFRVLAFNLGGVQTYRFTYSQLFSLPDGRELELGIVAPLQFSADGATPLDGPIVLDEEYFTVRTGTEAFQGRLDGDPLVRYGSCTYELLPPVNVEADLADGTRIRLTERFEEAESLLETAPAGFEHAEVTIGAETRVVTEYWQLVYSAFRHNTSPTSWVLFDTPVLIDGLADPVHGVELVTERPPNEPARAAYLGADLSVLREVALDGPVRRGDVGPPTPGHFLRGDAGTDGSLAITDAILVLGHLFQREQINCRKAADANDDGRVNIVDAIDIVSVLFRGQGLQELPEPFGACGEDPTPDDLTCQSNEACP